MNRVIRTEPEYQDALKTLERLLENDPPAGTPENEELELLVLLVQDYESRTGQAVPPEPVEAIRFRMEQQNLTPRDLVPYIGSRSKVSEVLSGKRTLTIAMVRALSSGLGIPAGVLIREPGQKLDWARFPMKQMVQWGWIKPPNGSDAASVEEALRPFLAAAGSLEPSAVFCRSSSHVRSGRAMDEYALAAWLARVLAVASEKQVSTEYLPETLTLDFLQNVARLSKEEDSPLRVADFLQEYGIQLVVERHLPHTYLDGAAIIISKWKPVIGLTLRYNRIDNFWFTLMHELAHVALHLHSESDVFYDDLDVDSGDDPAEQEANQLAGEALIPHEAWENSPASRRCIPIAAQSLAAKLGIHPAIVAGRMQREFKSYALLRNLVGSGEVRRLFPHVKWED